MDPTAANTGKQESDIEQNGEAEKISPPIPETGRKPATRAAMPTETRRPPIQTVVWLMAETEPFAKKQRKI